MSSDVSAAIGEKREDCVSIEDNVASADVSDNRETTSEKTVNGAEGFNAADEVTGIKLALVIVGLCFSNILTGLVSEARICPKRMTVNKPVCAH